MSYGMKYQFNPIYNQYLELVWTHHNGSDAQIRLCVPNNVNRFFFYKDSRTSRDKSSYTSWYSDPVQTVSIAFKRPSFPAYIGLGVDYIRYNLSWWINGELICKNSLDGWSQNRDHNANLKLYTQLYYDNSYISQIHIKDRDMKYKPPKGYISVYRVNNPIWHKIYIMDTLSYGK